ncbi:MAG: hypothetical protein R2845_15330 [Thermomicrobiales bacterium]
MTDTGYTIRDGIQHVVEGKLLSQAEAESIMDQIMSGETTGAQIGALVTALRMRGETIDEIAGFASAMRKHALQVELDLDGGPVVDTCGTGGDAAGTFNISTTASFAIAADGVRVAKREPGHDQQVRLRWLLEELGVRSNSRPSRSPIASTRSGSASCSRRSFTRPCAMSARPVAKSGSAPSSICLVR